MDANVLRANIRVCIDYDQTSPLMHGKTKPIAIVFRDQMANGLRQDRQFVG